MCNGCDIDTENDVEFTQDTATAMVALGSEFLTKSQGTEWASRINLDIFHIRNGETCIGGQLFGDWGVFRGVFPFVTYNEMCAMGFDDQFGRPDRYELLEKAWIEEVKRLTAE